MIDEIDKDYIHYVQEERFHRVLADIYKTGRLIAPRGQVVLECEDYTFTLPPRVRFCNFISRKLNLSYIKREFLWYLRANRYDTEITQWAKMWKSLINQDGSINSNYGQYIFNRGDKEISQFENVIETLKTDKDSRRASIMILNSDHLLSTTQDYPCTYSLNFRIRENKLKMTVLMRSQDAIFGLGNDIPCFSFIHEMVYVALRDLAYADLMMGEYTHTVNSLHIYERHFEMVKKIVDHEDEFVIIDCPEIESYTEVRYLLSFIHLLYGVPELAPVNRIKREVISLNLSSAEIITSLDKPHFDFSEWLIDFTLKEKKNEHYLH